MANRKSYFARIKNYFPFSRKKYAKTTNIRAKFVFVKTTIKFKKRDVTLIFDFMSFKKEPEMRRDKVNFTEKQVQDFLHEYL